MRYTLLDLTQHILSSMDSDQVTSIDDTVESTQVTYVIETVYNDIVSRANLPRHYTLFQLDPSGDAAKPVIMSRPSQVNSVDWVKYDCRTATDADQNMVTMTWMEPQDFAAMVQGLRVSDGNVLSYQLSILSGLLPLYCTNDKAPRFYTSFDDQQLVFNSFDAAVDSTLQSVKTTCWGERDITFQRANTWTADFDADQFSLFLNEAKALAFAELKQTSHAKAERSAREQWIHQQRAKSTITHSLPAIARLPNYGRR